MIHIASKKKNVTKYCQIHWNMEGGAKTGKFFACYIGKNINAFSRQSTDVHELQTYDLELKKATQKRTNIFIGEKQGLEKNIFQGLLLPYSPGHVRSLSLFQIFCRRRPARQEYINKI